MTYGYIYKTTNLINGKIYIGQHLGTFCHTYLGSGALILKAIKKYGKDNFRLEVLAFATNKLMLDGLELKFIYEYRQVFGDEFLYNLSDGGQGSTGWKPNEEQRRRMSIAHLGRPGTTKSGKDNHMWGQKHSETTKEKIRQRAIGRKSSLAGQPKPQQQIEKMRQTKIKQAASGLWKSPTAGKHLSLETRMKISAAHKARNKK